MPKGPERPPWGDKETPESPEKRAHEIFRASAEERVDIITDFAEENGERVDEARLLEYLRDDYDARIFEFPYLLDELLKDTLELVPQTSLGGDLNSLEAAATTDLLELTSEEELLDLEHIELSEPNVSLLKNRISELRALTLVARIAGHERVQEGFTHNFVRRLADVTREYAPHLLRALKIDSLPSPRDERYNTSFERMRRDTERVPITPRQQAAEAEARRRIAEDLKAFTERFGDALSSYSNLVNSSPPEGLFL